MWACTSEKDVEWEAWRRARNVEKGGGEGAGGQGQEEGGGRSRGRGRGREGEEGREDGGVLVFM